MAAACSPLTITGVPATTGVSTTSAFMGWWDILDFASQYSSPGATTDATEWVQESINLAVATGKPLYFTPRPYVISGSILITGACTLLGLDSSLDTFEQEGSPYLLTGSAAATFVATSGNVEMLCVTGDDVVIQNINFVSVHSTEEGGMAIHLSGNSNVSISDVAIFGTRNGILIDSASNVTIEDVLFVPYPSTTTPRYGIKADGLAALQAFGPSGAASNTKLINCVVDQTVHPYAAPAGAPQPFVADGFVIDNGYQGLTCDGCVARAARYGFVSRNTSGGATGRPGDFVVSFCRAYDCVIGVNLVDGEISVVEDSLILLDSAFPPSGGPNYGIQVADTYGSGPISLSSNVIFGNSSHLIGIDLEGSSAVNVNGGMVSNCGKPGSDVNGTGLRINAPASGNYLVQGLVVTNCNVAGVEVLDTHDGNATLIGLNLAGNQSGVMSGSAYGLLIDTPGASGTLLVNGCVFNENDVDVQNGAPGLGTAPKALHKLTNNAGISGVVITPPSLVNDLYNNSGNDVFVYVASAAGPATITVNGESASGVGDIPGVFFVPDTGGLAVSGGAVWTWLPS